MIIDKRNMWRVVNDSSIAERVCTCFQMETTHAEEKPQKSTLCEEALDRNEKNYWWDIGKI